MPHTPRSPRTRAPRSRTALRTLALGLGAAATLAATTPASAGTAGSDGATDAPTVELPWAEGVEVPLAWSPDQTGPARLLTSSTFGQVDALRGPADEVQLPVGLTTGADGNVWFADPLTDRIGRVTPAGEVTTFTADDVHDPVFVALGDDGNVWFTSAGNDRIGRITPAGEITTFTGPGVDGPSIITPGPDGALWFTSILNDRIGRITTDGEITTFRAEVDAPLTITAGPDGALWYTGYRNSRLGRITTDGEVTTFRDEAFRHPMGIAPGPDGTLWFTHLDGLGRITTDGEISSEEPDTGCVLLPWIAPGPDGRMWSTCLGREVLVRFGLDGRPTVVDDGDLGSLEVGSHVLAAGPDGDLWFSDGPAPGLARLDVGPRFADVGFVHPFYDPVDWVAGTGVATGYGDGTYRPAQPVTREAMAAFLYRAAGEPAFTPPASSSFVDVPDDHPFRTAIEWLAAEGIAEGDPEGTFRPTEPVSRAAMAAFLYRAAGEPGTSVPASPTFSDVDLDHPFFMEVEWLHEAAIAEGHPDGTFRPIDPVSRAAMAAFLYRAD